MSALNFGDDLAYIEYDQIKVQTSKATLYVIGGDEYWIPHSQIKDGDAEEHIFAIPKWLAEKKGLEGAYS